MSKKLTKEDWDRHRDIILRYYVDQNMTLPTVCKLMDKEHGFVASERMYKLRFVTWGARKYKPRTTGEAPTDPGSNNDDLSEPKSGESHTEIGLSQTLDDDPERESDAMELDHSLLEGPQIWPPLSPPVFQHPLTKTELQSSLTQVGKQFPSTSPSPSVTAMPFSHNSPRGAISDVGLPLTPDSYQKTPISGGRTPNSDPRTPESHKRGNDLLLSNIFRSGLDPLIAVLNQNLPSPPDQWPTNIPRSVPAAKLSSISQELSSIPQVWRQGMSPSSCSDRMIPSHVRGRSIHNTSSRPGQASPESYKTQCMYSAELDLLVGHTPIPDKYYRLCFYANFHASRGETSAVISILGHATRLYQKLVEQADDQVLSILNLAFIMVYLHGQKQLAVNILTRACSAASKVLGADDPISQSIDFAISMASDRSTSSEDEIWRLRQVRQRMSQRWGEDHKHTIVADHNLAWSLSYNKPHRLEALNIVTATYDRARRALGSVHIQTVAFLLIKARMQACFSQYFDAAEASAQAVSLIRQWERAEDTPYYKEAQRRDNWFQERRFTVTACF